MMMSMLVSFMVGQISKILVLIECRFPDERQTKEGWADLRERIAVRVRGCRHLRRPERSARTRPVLYNNRPPQVFFRRARERTQADIPAGSRRQGHDERD